MSQMDAVRRWAQNNPQLATSLMSMMVVGGFAAATGDLASFDGGVNPMGGTTSNPGP
jgi:hypothetical protein